MKWREPAREGCQPFPYISWAFTAPVTSKHNLQVVSLTAMNVLLAKIFFQIWNEYSGCEACIRDRSVKETAALLWSGDVGRKGGSVVRNKDGSGGKKTGGLSIRAQRGTGKGITRACV